WPESAQRHDMPGTILLSPIARRLPVFTLDRCPAVGEPKGRRRVSAGGDKFDPLGVRNEMAGDAHARNDFVVSRRFVVETEAVTIMANHMHTGRHVDVTARAQRRVWRFPFGIVNRVGGILR